MYIMFEAYFFRQNFTIKIFHVGNFRRLLVLKSVTSHTLQNDGMMNLICMKLTNEGSNIFLIFVLFVFLTNEDELVTQ